MRYYMKLVVLCFLCFGIIIFQSCSLPKEKAEKDDMSETTTMQGAEFICNEFSLKFRDPSMDENGNFSVVLDMNNCSSMEYNFVSTAIVVNDGIVNANHSVRLESHRKKSEMLDISRATLDFAGILKVGKIEIYFDVYNADETLVIQEGMLYMELSEYDLPMYSGHYLYNMQGIKIYGRYVDETTIWGSSIQIFCENNTNNTIYVVCENVKLNGDELNKEYAEEILAYKHSVDLVRLSSERININDIVNTDEIEVKFKIYDSITKELIAETNPILFIAN